MSQQQSAISGAGWARLAVVVAIVVGVLDLVVCDGGLRDLSPLLLGLSVLAMNGLALTLCLVGLLRWLHRGGREGLEPTWDAYDRLRGHKPLAGARRPFIQSHGDVLVHPWQWN